MSAYPAIAMLELAGIAIGTRVADAMVKRAPIETFRVGTVQPGKYLILVGGSVAAVEEAHLEGLRLAGDALTGQILLPHAHQQVVEALEGRRRSNDGDALGVIETSCLPAVVLAADRAVKTAEVAIVEIRLGDGLGGRGITEVTGSLDSVEAAVAAGLASIEGVIGESIVTQSVVIPAQHDELRERMNRSTSFFE